MRENTCLWMSYWPYISCEMNISNVSEQSEHSRGAGGRSNRSCEAHQRGRGKQATRDGDTITHGLKALPEEIKPVLKKWVSSTCWPQTIGGPGRNRTGIRGFAVRCITTLPPDPRSGAAYIVRRPHRGQVRHNRTVGQQPAPGKRDLD